MKNLKILMVAIMLIMSNVASAQTVKGLFKAFGQVLEEYCIEFYDKDFPGRTYIQETLVVNIPSDPDDCFNPLTGEYELTGTHSYKGQTRSTHSNVKWRAYLKKISGNKYSIRFDKWYERDPLYPFAGQDAHWEKGPKREYEYNP